MLEAKIHIDKELAARAYINALGKKTLRGLLPFYAVPYFLALTGSLAVVSALDSDYNLDHKILVIRLSLLFVVLWIGQVAVTFIIWRHTLAKEQVGASFHASLDSEGVTVRSEEIRRPWSDYTAYTEYEDYLQLTGPGGQFSFIPKRAELEEIIAFTKEKISSASVKQGVE